jgi:hypothetical protein
MIYFTECALCRWVVNGPAGMVIGSHYYPLCDMCYPTDRTADRMATAEMCVGWGMHLGEQKLWKGQMVS